MDFAVRLDAIDKRTGASVETVRAIFTGLHCNSAEEFNREYSEDICEYLWANGFKRNYPEALFRFSMSFCSAVVDGETVRLRGCE